MTVTADQGVDRLAVLATLARAASSVRGAFGLYVKATLLLQGAAWAVAIPLIVWLFDTALRWAGVSSLTHLNVGHVLTTPAAAGGLVVLAFVACVVVLVQQGAFLLIGDRLTRGEPVAARAIAADLARAARKLLSPQLALFLGYFFVLVPVGGIGAAAFLVQGIAIPNFIITELKKFDGGLYVYAAFLAAVTYLYLRLALTLAVFLTTDASVAGSMAASWRMTRRLSVRLLAMFAAVVGAAGLVLAAVVALGLLPTRVADAVAPGAAAVVAGLSLTVVQVIAFFVAGAVAALGTQIVVLVARARAPQGAPVTVPDVAVPDAAVPDVAVPDAARAPRRAVRLGVGIVVVGALAAVSVLNTHAMTTLSDEAPTLVIAHRGDASAAVENSIAALESAAALGADYVELDVLQSADGGLVVFHDLTLRRLAGSDRAVADMTLAELTATTITQNGFTATIPSLAEFVERAKELDMPLLVELKAHGRETASFVDDVVALLRAKGVAGTYLVQSIYPELADAVRAAAPEIGVGYVVPFSRGGLGDPPVDFVAIEEFSYTARVRAEARAAGIDVFVWTVNDPAAMRQYLRAGADGIVMSAPREAVAERTAFVEQTGLSGRLEDLVRVAMGR
ncbi:glycerophosphodiester phosphodiesterase [Sanguibacter gelidistatuariae]|uniref:glycerophosphodiester phosphodiesterase n=1 Tax=Sanguibacter gelidistatuariae TaxID=1814289 RepID=UPI0015881F09|nr:glycerophosphodiester phosphodiesterase [Sanguibacter gelidistatuariae]